MVGRDVLLLSLLVIITISVDVAFADREPHCVYTFYIETGQVESAGTDSIISVKISDKSGQDIDIPNIVTWGGLMGPSYDYFEKGSLDIFSGKAQCLPSPICSLSLTSDGSGVYPAWFVNYVDVTTVSVQAKSAHQYFDVEQWLATDTPPYNLTVARDNCKVSPMEGIGRVGSEIRKSLS
ncbi:PLAT/LH2 domain-containing protein [Hirschfeldia incana]|nr:PLAT/LH2 domain-containing protein [Hirschfeldia incana]